jgi:chromatin segregation and condensation protein Rec8/ScpA/Scc1 (kleisin family)
MAMSGIIRNLPQKITKPKVQVRTVISLETMIAQLRERIEKQMKFNFKDFTGNTVERSLIIVGFLAVLEMVKQGSILVRQAVHFDDIEIEQENTTTPRYQ